MKKMINFVLLLIGINMVAQEYQDYYYEFGKKVKLTPITNYRDLECCDGVLTYKTEDGRVVKFKNEIIVKLKDGVDPKKLFEEFNITNFSKLANKTFIIKVPCEENLLSLAKKLYESNQVKYAIPNKIKNYHLR